eukprot:125807-Rhodomonas_salina.1
MPAYMSAKIVGQYLPAPIPCVFEIGSGLVWTVTGLGCAVLSSGMVWGARSWYEVCGTEVEDGAGCACGVHHVRVKLSDFGRGGWSSASSVATVAKHLPSQIKPRQRSKQDALMFETTPFSATQPGIPAI